MTIGKKMGVGFGVAILALVLILSVTNFSLIRLEKEFKEIEELSTDVQVVDKLAGTIANTESATLTWLRLQTEDSRQNLIRYQTNLQDRLSDTDNAIQNPERREVVADIKEDIDAFYSGVERTVALMDQRNEQVSNRMDIYGPEARRTLSRISKNAYADGNYRASNYASSASEALLLARFYAYKFLLTNETDAVDVYEKHRATFIERVEKVETSLDSQEDRDLLASAKAQFEKYHQAFGNAQDIILKRNNAIKTEVLANSKTLSEMSENLLASIKDTRTQKTAVYSQTKDSARLQAASVGVVGLVLACLFAYLITRQITLPVREAQDVISKLADGELTYTVPERTGKDEIANMMRELKGLSVKLKDTVGSIQGISLVIKDNSDEMADSSEGLSSRVEEQASTLEETASSMEELTSTVKTNADSAKEASDATANTRNIAQKGSEVANEAGQAMEKINDSSKQITEIINVIDEIAFQTNLLALNAAVEAARAGDAGRGFAVVAQEVRTLAQRSAESSKDIKNLIDDSSAQVKDGVSLVQKAVDSLQDIYNAVDGVSDTVDQIAKASGEQATSLDEVNQAVMEMDNVTQQNASMAQQSRNIASNLQNKSDELARAVAFFKINQSDIDTTASRTALNGAGQNGGAFHRHSSSANGSAANGAYTNGSANGSGANSSYGNGHGDDIKTPAIPAGQHADNEVDWKEF